MPTEYAFEELRSLFEQRVGRIITREEFNTALRVDGLRSYSTDTPDTADRKRWQARQRATAGRLRERA